MKERGIYIALLLLLSACSKEANIIYDNVTSLKLSATQTSIVTKGTESVLPQGTVAGIYVTAKDASVEASYYKNQKYTSQTSGTLLTDANVSLTIGSSYDLYAYAPYLSGTTTPSSVEVLHNMDVLWAKKVTLNDVTPTNNTAALSFEHCATQISFKVVFAEDFDWGPKLFTTASTLWLVGFIAKEHSM